MRKSELGIYGLQHLLAMISACILVPLLTGFPVSIALFASGVGTIIFYFVTDKKVPIYLGSSFAFIAPLAYVVSNNSISAALGGVIVAGLIYIVVSFGIIKGGANTLHKLFPTRVTAPIIMLIGLTLAPVAVEQLQTHYIVGIVTLLVTAFFIITKSTYFSAIPILAGIGAGYLVSIPFGLIELTYNPIIGLPEFTLPTFNLNAIMLIAPLAIVSIIEHVGDIVAAGEVTEHNYLIDPGIEKTLLGDGLATLFAGLVGGIPNTTYSENIGVLKITEKYNPKIMVTAGIFAILLSFSPFVTGVINSIPQAVIGGVSILLFGMIFIVGLESLVSIEMNKADNIVIATTMIVGLGGSILQFGNIEFSSLAVASIVAIVLNLIIKE